MAQLQLDRELWVAIPLFTLGAAISLQLVSPDLFGFDFTQVLVTLGTAEITVARAMSIAALIGVVVNRDVGISDFRSFSGIEAWVVYVTLGLIIAPPFLPAVEGTVVQEPWSFVSFVVQTMGIAIVSYLN